MRPILSTFPRCSTGRLAHSHRAAIGCPGLTHNQHPVPLGRHLPICPPPAPGTRPPGLSVGEVGFFSMLCARDGMVLVVSGLPHSARCPPRASLLSPATGFPPFLGRMSFHCVPAPCFLIQSLSHEGAGVFSRLGVHFLWENAQESDCRATGQFFFYFSEEPPCSSTNTHLHQHLARVSFFSTSSPTLVFFLFSFSFLATPAEMEVPGARDLI